MPRRKFKRSDSIGARAGLIKTRNYVRFFWEKDGVKSFTLILTILWLFSKLKSSNQNSYQTTLNGIVINSELAILPEKLCLMWAATRDFKQRKFNLPSNHRYGLNFQINQKLFHVFLLILLSGDVAINPGPCSSQNSVIKCLALNARSLKSIHRDPESNRAVCNLERFQDLVYNENSDVICVNETWLTDEVCNKDILHSGFTIYRKDRTNRCDGGVLIAIKTETFKSVKEYQPDIEELQQLEIVSTEVRTANNQELLFCCCYRPPDADLSWTDAFNTFLNHACEQYQNIVISGDFNFPKIQWDEMDKTNSVNDLLFVEMLNDHFLCQLNNTPTRGNNVLDLVITSVPNHVRLTETLSPEQSSVFTDHDAISFDFTAFIKAPRKSVRTVYDYAKGDLDGLRTALQATDLSSLISDSDNIDNDWQRWKNTFLTTVSAFIPKKKIKGRNPLPWINSDILHKIKKKDSIRRKIKAKPTSYLKEKYKSLRSEIKKLLRESRENYFGSIDNSFKDNPKRFWSALKQRSKSCSIPDRISMPPSPATAFLNHPDQSNLPSRPIATNPNEIADFFNTYFASVFTSENLPVQHPNRTDPVLTELKVTELEVETLLNSLDTNKATGSDEIPARLLKETASIITPSICKLFNKSLQQGTVPQDWKLANVVPVYKKGDKEYTENYRPISLLPIISKVLERYIFMNIRQHFSGIIYDHQHGFLQGKSCVTNLLEALDYIGACLDKGGQVDMVYLDMSKAFDRINHKRLTSKLANSGIGGNLLKWFQSYLTDRRQRVTVLGVTSKSLPVCSGVPQGSILGPALFLLYVNDLLEAPTSSRAAMFADDTKIFSAIQSKIDVTSLQTDLGTLEHWSTVSGLSFNQSKCKRQTLTRKKAPVASSYKLDNSIISITDNERDLGVVCLFKILQPDERYTWHWLGRTLATQHRFGHHSQWNL